jgi:D-arabinose 1-dehydrogenase-like Zn-dependent alcohol dehydrogenase
LRFRRQARGCLLLIAQTTSSQRHIRYLGFVMRAIRFEVFGDPSVLELAEVPAPLAYEMAAVVRVMAASINPSDVKNVAGGMKQTTLPRIPGRDFVGVVEAGPVEWIGAEVWGTGGDAGFIRDGSHAELIAVPVASLRRKPDALSFDQAAVVDVNYIAAWCGIEAAGLKAGETVLLIGAGGGVGGAAAQVARHLGACVIGADRRVPHPDAPIHAIAEKLIIDVKDLPAEVRAATNGKGADVSSIWSAASSSEAPSTASPMAAGSSKLQRPAGAKCAFLSQRGPAPSRSTSVRQVVRRWRLLMRNGETRNAMLLLRSTEPPDQIRLPCKRDQPRLHFTGQACGPRQGSSWARCTAATAMSEGIDRPVGKAIETVGMIDRGVRIALN